MFRDYVFKRVNGRAINKIIIIDKEGFNNSYPYESAFEEEGFLVIDYKDDLSLRIAYDADIKNKEKKIVIIAKENQYIPYDVISVFSKFVLDYKYLFPRLNQEELIKANVDLDMLSLAYEELYEDFGSDKEATQRFVQNVVYGVKNVQLYCDTLNESLVDLANSEPTYKDWYQIAKIKAIIDLHCAKHHLPIITDYVDGIFQKFILEKFGSLSGNLDKTTPVLVSKAMDYMRSQSDKFAIVVMDGMSEFDWHILSKQFTNISYKESAAFAMIPTVTSISRQCLLSNKYPNQLISPWNQSKEKQEFMTCARQLGFKDDQIAYERGYNFEFSPLVKYMAVIINGIDDQVHAELNGKEGMYNNISRMSEKYELAKLCKKLMTSGFDVYITSDHGNTLCTGIGRMTKAGVETETKGHRMVVLNQLGDKNSIKEKYGLIEYPKYYLDKDNDYLVCKHGTSLDNNGDVVMSHGGISIDEVVVPFIKMKAGI